MRPRGLVEEADKMLRAHGFRSVVNDASPDSCFDIVAKSCDTSVIIKVVDELSDVPRNHISELHAISSWIAATPLILAEKVEGQELDDDAVYYKNGIYAVSLGALERTLEGDPPLVEVFPAGCFVYIDGELVRKRREELGLSVGELARLVGVSRMTIYSYEKGRKRTTPSIAYRLAYVLGAPIVIPMNPLAPRGESQYQAQEPVSLVRDLPRKGLLRLVARVLRKLKLMIMAFFNAPFEIMARHEDLKLVMNVVCNCDYDGAKIKTTKAFTEVMELNHLVVRPEGYECPEDVPSIGVEELKNMRKPEELAKLFT